MAISREEIEAIGKAAGKHTYNIFHCRAEIGEKLITSEGEDPERAFAEHISDDAKYYAHGACKKIATGFETWEEAEQSEAYSDPPGERGNNIPVVIKKDDTLVQALEEINRKIDSRRSYGVRREELPTTYKAQKLVWSNAGARWYVAPVQDEIRCADSEEISRLVDQGNIIQRTCDYSMANMDKGIEAMRRLRELEKEGKTKCRFVPSKTQCLDANEVAVIGVPKRLLESIAPMLNDLPLYAGSFEVRERGVFSLRGIEIPPPLKEAWLRSMVTGEPLDIQSQIAIERKIQED